MKSLARSYIYWPGIDADIERIAKSCSSCRQRKPTNAHAHMMPWPCAQRPWQRIHMDFCGLLYNQYWLVIVESISMWSEIFYFIKMPDTGKMLTKLKFLFASMGLPEEYVSDNGSQFTSEEFHTFSANEWHSTEVICTILPCHKWVSRTYGTHIPAVDARCKVGRLGNCSCNVLVFVPNNPSQCYE